MLPTCTNACLNAHDHCTMCHDIDDIPWVFCVSPVPQWISTLLGSSFEGVGMLQRKLAANAKWPNWVTWSDVEQWSGGWLEGNSPMVRTKKPTIGLVRNWDYPHFGWITMDHHHPWGRAPSLAKHYNGRAGRVSEHSSVGKTLDDDPDRHMPNSVGRHQPDHGPKIWQISCHCTTCR